MQADFLLRMITLGGFGNSIQVTSKFRTGQTNTIKIKGAFLNLGKYKVIVVGTLKDNNKVVKKDTVSVTFVKST